MSTIESRADARTRAWRTALQGAVSAVLVAVAAVVTDTATPGNPIDWPTLGAAAGTAALTALAAWVQRTAEGAAASRRARNEEA